MYPPLLAKAVLAVSYDYELMTLLQYQSNIHCSIMSSDNDWRETIITCLWNSVCNKAIVNKELMCVNEEMY